MKTQKTKTENIKIRQGKLYYIIIVVLFVMIFLVSASRITDHLFVRGEKSIKVAGLTVDSSFSKPFLSDKQLLDMNGIKVIGYHDVVADTKKALKHYDINEETLKTHFNYFREQGYRVLSLDEYIRIAQGELKAPEKSILLTFDDGEVGFYRYVYPLLKEYNYNAVISLIGSKIGKPDKQEKKTYVTWEQVRKMEASGLVDAVSHTYGLHYQDNTDPFGSYAAASSQTFWSSYTGYEDDGEYIDRVENDLEIAQEQMQEELGHKSQVLVWPFGEFNQIGMTIAKKNDFKVFMTMLEGANIQNTPQAMQYVRRNFTTVDNQKQIERFMTERKNQQIYRKSRTVQISIEDIYVEGDLIETSKNADKLANRLKQGKINSVIIKTYNDTGVYFRTDHAPVIDNIYNVIALRFTTKDFFVYAKLPSIGSPWLKQDKNQSYVKSTIANNPEWYKRISPFSQIAVENLELLYEDFAKHAAVNGIMFQNDFYLDQNEDFSEDAARAYYLKFDEKLDHQVLNNPSKKKRWEAWKTSQLDNITIRLMKRVRVYKPFSLSMREIYGDVVVNEGKKYAFSQDYTTFLKKYDITVINASPHLRIGETLDQSMGSWMDELVDNAVEKAGNKSDRIIFNIQINNLEEENLALVDKFAKDYNIKHVVGSSKSVD